MTLVINLWLVPNDWQEQLMRLNMQWEEWRPKPIADSILLINVKNVPDTLPFWLYQLN